MYLGQLVTRAVGTCFCLVWKGVRAAVPCNYPIFTRMAMQLDKLNEGKRTKLSCVFVVLSGCWNEGVMMFGLISGSASGTMIWNGQGKSDLSPLVV